VSLDRQWRGLGERAVIWVLAVGAVALGFVVAISSAALVEAFRQLAELRDTLKIHDEPIPLRLKAGELRIDEIGLPPELGAEPKAIAIFLSTKCATCLTIAEAFRGGSPGTVWFVLPTPPTPTELLGTLSQSAERVIVDENSDIADSLGLNVTPSVITTSYGEITRAQAVSTPRQVLALIPTVFPLDSGKQRMHNSQAALNA
jgi:hypothetical protein